jgi:hypothetical protein
MLLQKRRSDIYRLWEEIIVGMVTFRDLSISPSGNCYVAESIYSSAKNVIFQMLKQVQHDI